MKKFSMAIPINETSQNEGRFVSIMLNNPDLLNIILNEDLHLQAFYFSS